MNWDMIEIKWSEMARRAVGDRSGDAAAEPVAGERGGPEDAGRGAGPAPLPGATARPERARS